MPVPKDREPDAVPVSSRIPVPSAEQIDKAVKPAVTTATILTIIGMIILSPIGL